MWSRLFQNAWQVSLGERLFLAARWLLTPYAQIAQAVPGEGRVLDFGCGHGLLSLHLADTAAQRSVVGVDHDSKRISAARRAGQCLANVRFCDAQDPLDWSEGFRCVVFMDMLHYLTFEEQRHLLTKAYESLDPEGVIVVREVERARGLRYALNYVYECVATRIGFTKSSQETLFVRSREDWTALLDSMDLEVAARRVSFFLFSDVLFVARKPQGSVRFLQSERSAPCKEPIHERQSRVGAT